MRIRISILAFAASLIGVTGQAQTVADLERDCLTENVLALSPAQIGEKWKPFHPAAIEASVAPAVARGDFEQALPTVISAARGASAFIDDAAFATAFKQRLEVLALSVDALLKLPPHNRSRFLASSVRPAGFVLGQSPASGSILIGNGPGQMILPPTATVDTRRGVCWSSIALASVFSSFNDEARLTTVRNLTALAERWDNFASKGYSQLPWELALNGLGYDPRKQRYEPPKAQFILLHPAAGVEMVGTNIRALRRANVATLEGIGRLWYNDDYTRYWGLSVIAAFASDASPSIGPYMHLWWPQAKLGVMFGANESKSTPSFLVSLDLYGFFTGAPSALQEKKAEALAASALAPK
ncbi:MAG TPA: hypothetical protein VKA54_20360 [Gemmatimonadaceae bacterium]|nr:hypothetical protein [Gemmatimonadaceae bacterium]